MLENIVDRGRSLDTLLSEPIKTLQDLHKAVR